jgi:hypothetical protein
MGRSKEKEGKERGQVRMVLYVEERGERSKISCRPITLLFIRVHVIMIASVFPFLRQLTD